MNKAFKKYGKSAFTKCAPAFRSFSVTKSGFIYWVGCQWQKTANTTFNIGAMEDE